MPKKRGRAERENQTFRQKKGRKTRTESEKQEKESEKQEKIKQNEEILTNGTKAVECERGVKT